MPSKHYIFFGHIAKKQEYNIPLFKSLIQKKITFSDYEYFVDDNNHRLVAFGWYAGAVGVYYTLMGWGKRTGEFELPRPTFNFSIEELITNLKQLQIDDLRIVITGNGRVSNGAQYVLDKIGAHRLDCNEFATSKNAKGISYCVAVLENLVAPNNKDTQFNEIEFKNNPEKYHSTFDKFAKSADILISGHFWGNNQPIYITEDDCCKPNFRIKMIGDITCDIQGSIKTTLRSSTHSEPFYDYNPITKKEEAPFSSNDNITVMAVDTCPNALPRVTSEYFGTQLIKYVLKDLLQTDGQSISNILKRATILCHGKLTPDFAYLKEYVASFNV